MLKKITQDSDFNEMMEFIKEEVISLMTAQQILKEEQEEILPIMKENYDGYKFLIDAKQRENCIALEGNIDKEQIIKKKRKLGDLSVAFLITSLFIIFIYMKYNFF